MKKEEESIKFIQEKTTEATTITIRRIHRN